jgi:hypothetical protein
MPTTFQITETATTAGIPVPLIANTGATAAGDNDTAGGAPIACTLGAGEMSSRLDEWRFLLRGVTARRRLDDGLRVEFGPDTDVTEVARLAATEQSCCRFFDFALVIDGRGVALEVHAPPVGQPVLTALFGAAG